MKVEVYKDLQQRIPEVRNGTSLGLLPAHAPSTPLLTAPPHPLQRIVEKAVVGMLPKNSYGRELFRHLKVYKGAAHPHEAQVKRCRRRPAAPASHVSRPASLRRRRPRRSPSPA